MQSKLKKLLTASIVGAFIMVPTTTLAANTYNVVPGDTLWKISMKTEIGVSELIKANKQLQNPNLIYPGQTINIPGDSVATNTNTSQDVEQEVVRLVNIERGKAGLPALKYDQELARVAEKKSLDMKDNNYFSHTSPVYGSPFNMMKNNGIQYKSAGENIAKGQRSAQEVMNAWMNSSGHRANILNKDFTHIGVGYVESGNYWTQMFIAK